MMRALKATITPRFFDEGLAASITPSKKFASPSKDKCVQGRMLPTPTMGFPQLIRESRRNAVSSREFVPWVKIAPSISLSGEQRASWAKRAMSITRASLVPVEPLFSVVQLETAICVWLSR